jgi:alpha-tubulin suppressor-like RCC1 family protein
MVVLALLGSGGSAYARVNGAIAPDAETTKEPKITKQPTSKTVEEGESVNFESTASGTPTPSVQWEASTNGGSTWGEVPGATETKLTIASAKTSESGDKFRAVFSNGVGKPATSKEAILTVRAAPVVTEEPKSVAVEEGQNATFEAAASGLPVPTVQWELSTNNGGTWRSISQATSDQLTVTDATTSLSGHEYRAIFTNALGKADTEAATLTVQKAPAVTKTPSSVTVTAGEPADFEASASGFPTPSVQWELSTDAGSNWSPIPGATSEQLTIAETQASEDGYLYRAVFTNAAGTATSAAASLTVHSLPVITEQPSSTTIQAGEAATFEATASGVPEPTVQWELSTNAGSSWSAIAGATSDRLTIEAPTAAQSGDEYRAVFTDTGGSKTTDAATLTVATTRYGAIAWGENLSGQLGNGSNEQLSDAPVPVSALEFVTSVAAGGSHSLALLADGHVMAWGGNAYGQLGNGTTNNASTPVEVHGLSDVTAIAAGANHSLALLSNGTMMAWGANEHGQVGDGKVSKEEEPGEQLPVPVTGLTGVTAIAAGGNHSLALLSNGTVMAWGENEEGELGDGSHADAHSPVLVKDLSGATAVAAGANFSLALTNKETVKAWGSDLNGQLADSEVGEENDESAVPVVAEGLTGVIRIAAGAAHALALLANGTVEAWGENHDGALGDGKLAESQETPVQVIGLTDVRAISAGTEDSLALLDSGSVMSFGANQWGQLGNGTSGGFSDVPVEVAGLREVASISAGGAHMLALGEQIPVVTSLSPKFGPAGGGTSVKVNGDTFTGATKVMFGSAEATNVNVESATSITATAPPGTGTVNVEVSTPTGTSASTTASRYTYAHQPTVKKLSVKSGPARGNTTVVITGTEFIGVTAVAFGEATASFTVNSTTTITAVSPPGASGTVDIAVTASGGTSAKVSADHFKYTPTIEQVAPNEGSTAGGTPVTVNGSGFALGTTATTFKFAKTKAKSVDCTSATSCTMTAPAHAAETVSITATVNKAASSASAADEFTYN